MKHHQPLIVKQGSENVSSSSKPTHSIENTTAVLNNETDWHRILKQDLCLSSSAEEISVQQPKASKISMGTNTDRQLNPDTDRAVNTSPLCIADTGMNKSVLLNTHDAPNEIKQYLKISKKPTTQIGCVPLVRMKDNNVQTDEKIYDNCTYEERLILSRQSYIIKDAIRNTIEGYQEPTTSREDRHRSSLPNSTSYNKWMNRFKPDPLLQKAQRT